MAYSNTKTNAKEDVNENLSSDNPLFERHRPFLRKLEKSYSQTYGYGGSMIFGIGVVLPALLAWKYHWFKAPILYIAAFLMVCIGFFVLRIIVKRKRTLLLDQFMAYCTTNQLDLKKLSDDIREDHTYEFLISLLEQVDEELITPKDVLQKDDSSTFSI